MNKLFVVKMIRYGNHSGHSYIDGVYNDYHLASMMGKYHNFYRGGKYDPVIYEFNVPEKYNSDVVTIIVINRKGDTNSKHGIDFRVIKIGDSENFCRENIRIDNYKICTFPIITKNLKASEEFLVDLHSLSLNNEESEILRWICEDFLRENSKVI